MLSCELEKPFAIQVPESENHSLTYYLNTPVEENKTLSLEVRHKKEDVYPVGLITASFNKKNHYVTIMFSRHVNKGDKFDITLTEKEPNKEKEIFSFSAFFALLWSVLSWSPSFLSKKEKKPKTEVKKDKKKSIFVRFFKWTFLTVIGWGLFIVGCIAVVFYEFDQKTKFLGDNIKKIPTFGSIEKTIKDNEYDAIVLNKHPFYESDEAKEFEEEFFQERNKQISLKEVFNYAGEGVFATKETFSGNYNYNEASNICAIFNAEIPTQEQLSKLLAPELKNYPFKKEEDVYEWTSTAKGVFSDDYLIFKKKNYFSHRPKRTYLIDGNLYGDADDVSISFRCIFKLDE